jgi:hypothetical protein
MMSNEAKKGVHSGSNLSVGPSDKSACSEDLSKTASRSRHTGLKKQYKDPFAQTGPSIIEVDSATNTVTVPAGASIFGTNDQPSIKTLVAQVLGVTPNSGEHNLQTLKWGVATVESMAPSDGLEGLLAVQMIGIHYLAMECLRRASLTVQTHEEMDAHLERAIRLARTFTSQMEALNRNRGKISHQMVVGSVNVNEGGQAIVGSVEHRDAEKVSAENDTKKHR